MPRLLSFLLPLCLFVAFLLLFLVSLSTPIIKALYLIQVKAIPALAQPVTTIATDLQFGIWGFCATSAFKDSTLLANGECTPARLGYQLDSALLALTGYPDIAQAVLKGLSVVLVLHPIAAGLTFIAFLCSFPASGSHGCGIVSLLIGIIAALLTTVVLAVDFTLIGVAKSRIDALTGTSFNVSYGNCAWMVLVATVFLWVALVLGSIVVCNCCGCGQRRNWEWDEKFLPRRKR